MNYYIIPGLKIRPVLNKKSKITFYNPNVVINIVLQHFDTTINNISAKRRFGYLVEQRHILQYLLMRYTSMSCKAIGEMFGQDHSTVLHARDTVQKELDAKYENDFQKHIPELLNKIRYES